MATAQMQKTQSKTWGAIFPTEQLTEQKSTLFVKKLLAVAISNITYLRAIFPEHAFGDKCLEDLNLKVLRDESSCPGACQVIKWVKGCFDALDKKYLRTLVIGIYVDPDNPATVIESYTFKFTYNNHGEVDIYRNNKKISSAHSAEETKKATIRLLRTLIILTNTLSSLPDSVMMTMKLFYYDEITPADYEPPGFKASSDDPFVFAEEATNIAIGEVATPFHLSNSYDIGEEKWFVYQYSVQFDRVTFKGSEIMSCSLPILCERPELMPLYRKPMQGGQLPSRPPLYFECGARLEIAVKMRVKTGSKQFEMHEDPVEDMEEGVEESLSINNAGLDHELNGTSVLSKEVTCNKDAAVPAVTSTCEGKQTPSNINPPNPGSVVNSDKRSANEFQVRCPCGCNEDDGLMIMCSNCMFWQHGICFLITSETKAPDNHICDVCAKQDNGKHMPTDPYLSGISSIAVQATCLWRRTLTAVMEFKSVLAPQLARRLGIENTVAQGLMNRLEKEGFISNSKRGRKLGKIVEKEKIETEGIPRYLKTPKTLSKPEVSSNVHAEMEVQATNKQPSESKESKTCNKIVDVLMEKTNKISLHTNKRGTRNSPSQKEISVPTTQNETKGRRGKKRAYSKTDCTEFEVASSQEMMSAKKKASTVTKDITV